MAKNLVKQKQDTDNDEIDDDTDREGEHHGLDITLYLNIWSEKYLETENPSDYDGNKEENNERQCLFDIRPTGEK